MKSKVLAALAAFIIVILVGLVIGRLIIQSELKEASDKMLGKTVVLDGQCYTITDHSRDSKTWTLSNGATISWELLKNLKRYETCPEENSKK